MGEGKELVGDRKNELLGAPPPTYPASCTVVSCS